MKTLPEGWVAITSSPCTQALVALTSGNALSFRQKAGPKGDFSMKRNTQSAAPSRAGRSRINASTKPGSPGTSIHKQRPLPP